MSLLVRWLVVWVLNYLAAKVLGRASRSFAESLEPDLTPVVLQVLGRIPVGPFLALTPARTPFGRSASVAVLLVALLGSVTVLSLTHGTWLLITALILAAVVAVGCALAYD